MSFTALAVMCVIMFTEHHLMYHLSSLLSCVLSCLQSTIWCIIYRPCCHVCYHVYRAPFDVSFIVLAVMCVVTISTWSENYGDTQLGTKETFANALKAIRQGK